MLRTQRIRNAARRRKQVTRRLGAAQSVPSIRTLARMIEITDLLPTRALRFGAVVASGVSPEARPDGYDEALAALLAERQGELPDPLDRRRIAVRESLRHGVYRPAGRAKPCPEYLLRTAQDDAFPRINAVVDASNFVCLGAMLPISLFDLDLAATDRMVLRYGRTGEAYVFNASGQTIDLEDLVVGAAAHDGDALADSLPLVNPVKDALAAKTTDVSTRVCALVYAPAVSDGALEAAVRDLKTWLARCGPAGGPPPTVAGGIVPAGGTLRLSR